jgi:protein required for attachment to host cells
MVIGDTALMSKDKREKIGNFLLPNAPTYIAACDLANARIYLTRRRFGDWVEVATLQNPDASLRDRDRDSDRPGRVFDSFGKGRHAMAPGETGRQQSTHRFAHEIANYLNRALTAGDFTHLVLMSDPTFLGVLRKELSASLQRSLCYEVSINPTAYDLEKLKSLFT